MFGTMTSVLVVHVVRVVLVLTPHRLQRGRDKQREVVLKKPTTRYYRTLPLALTRRPPRHRPRLAFPGRLATNPSEERGALLLARMSPYAAPATRRGAKRWLMPWMTPTRWLAARAKQRHPLLLCTRRRGLEMASTGLPRLPFAGGHASLMA